ncbi:MAG: hypothetical protein HFE66_00225 [Clostridiales bacterium]|jgi:antitoxin component YwqK of YwqJK toxin-antitoxin module|nr:hypothetical protein [Clostridiales bacterium]
MKKSIRIVLIIAVVLLVVGAGVCAILLFSDKPDNTKTPSTQTEIPPETQHENTEYRYNEDGQISKIIYYDNDVLQGSTDYVYTDDYTCIIHFDKDNEQTGYEQTNYNALKNPTKYIEKKREELVTSIEYDYYADQATLQKKTTKNYKDGAESAEKEYYDEAGNMTRKCTYEDGNLTSDITYTYDANGEVVESGPTKESGDTNAA